MVKKIIIAVVTFPIKVLWGNYELFERNVWPQQAKQATSLSVADHLEKDDDKRAPSLPRRKYQAPEPAGSLAVWCNMTKERIDQLEEVRQAWDKRPLTHWMGLSDSLWGHITENRIRIRHIEKVLEIKPLTDSEREKITNELKKEAQTQWYEAETKEPTLVFKKPNEHRVSWWLRLSSGICFNKIWVTFSRIRWPGQVSNLPFRNPQSQTKDYGTNKTEGKPDDNEPISD